MQTTEMFERAFGVPDVISDPDRRTRLLRLKVWHAIGGTEGPVVFSEALHSAGFITAALEALAASFEAGELDDVIAGVGLDYGEPSRIVGQRCRRTRDVTPSEAQEILEVVVSTFIDWASRYEAPRSVA